MSSSLASLLGDTIMSALFTDHATHLAAAQVTDPACAADLCDTAAASAGCCARDSCESGHATASNACSTDFIHDALVPAAMLRDVQAGSAVCSSPPDSPAVSLHKTSSSTGQALLNDSATAMPPEDNHSKCNVPVKVGIGVHISSAASHSASPESTASQLGVSQSEPGQSAASSAVEASSLNRTHLPPDSSGIITLSPADAQAAVESAGPSSQANSLSSACSLEQQLAMDTDPNSSSAVHTLAEAHRPTAPGARIRRTDSGASISTAASVSQLDAARGLYTAVDCQVSVSETGVDCLAGFSSANPSSTPRASLAATTSSARASPADQGILTQMSPAVPSSSAGVSTTDPSSPATTAPGATSITAGASPAGRSSPAGTSRSVPASPNDISSISVEPAADSGSSAGVSPAAAISQAWASPASSVSPAEASPAVAGSPAVSSPNASSQSGVYTPEGCPLQDTSKLQVAGCADPEQTQVQKGGKIQPALTAEALFEEMSHVADGSPLALAVVNHIPATMRSCEDASQQNASSNLAQQRDNSNGDSGASRQLGAEMLELMDACGVHESLKELLAADAQCCDYSADELLCSMCSNIRTVSCLIQA